MIPNISFLLRESCVPSLSNHLFPFKTVPNRGEIYPNRWTLCIFSYFLDNIWGFGTTNRTVGYQRYFASRKSLVWPHCRTTCFHLKPSPIVGKFIPTVGLCIFCYFLDNFWGFGT